jgi:hypothetical protein
MHPSEAHHRFFSRRIHSLRRAGGGRASSRIFVHPAIRPGLARLADNRGDALANPALSITLARIFHSFHHRYDHLSARVTTAGGGRRICGLDSKPPLRRGIKRSARLRKDCWLKNASKSCRALCEAFRGAVLPVARMCRPTDSVRGLATDCMQATE